MIQDRLANDLEEYYKLVNGNILTFSWKIFANFLITKGWVDKISINEQHEKENHDQA